MLSLNQKQYAIVTIKIMAFVINSELLNINWDGVYNSNSPNQSLSVMKSILKDTIDRHATFVTKRVKGKKSP